MFSNYSNKVIAFFIIPIAVFSVQRFSSLPIRNTVVWWVIHGGILIAFFWFARYTILLPEEKKLIRIVKWYLIWNVFSIMRGAFFMAENYWDYKALVTMGMTLLVPLFSYIALNEKRVQLILSIFIRYALPFAFIILPFSGIGAWGWYLFPISFLLLFLPVLTFKGRLLVLFIAIVVMIGGISVRSYLFKYGLPILLLGFYYLRYFPRITRIMEISRKIVIVAPILLFVLAVSGIFNVFKMSEYVDEDISFGTTTSTRNGSEYESKITDDSRTFLYVEVLSSAIKYDYWLLGRSPARGNETVWFAKEQIENIGKPERIINEAGILNVFTWTGIIGVIIIFVVFYKASYVAINQSKNIFAKIVGLFIALRWVYFWVEDYQEFDLNSIVIWMMIGVCFSSSFRRMSDAEVKLWVRGIFSKTHFHAYKKYVLQYRFGH